MVNENSKAGKVIKKADKFIGFFCSLAPFIIILILIFGGRNNVVRLEKEIELLKKQNQTLLQKQLPSSNKEVSAK